MIIKNVSTRVVRLEDFPDEKPLLPGGTIDLSKYTPAERAQSDQLQDLFTRRVLINLGFAPTSKKLSGVSLQKTSLSKYTYEDPSLNSTLVPATQMKPEIEGGLNRRDIPKATTAPERYNKDALDQYKYELANEQETVPEFVEKEFTQKKMHSFVQVQNEEQVLTLAIDEETGTTFAELSPGQVPTAFPKDGNIFIDKHVYTEEEVENQEKQREIVKERLLKTIEARVQGKCLFPRSDGKPCQRPIYHGFDRCYRHLKPEDQAKIRAKKEVKEVEKKEELPPQRLSSTELD